MAARGSSGPDINYHIHPLIMYGFPYLSVSSMQVSPPVLEKWFFNPQVLLLTRQHTNPTDVPPLPASPQRNNVQSQRIHTSMCQAITVHPHHPVSSTSPSTAMFRLHRLFSAWFRQWPCNSSQPLMTLPEKTFRQCQADSLNGPSQTTIVSEPANAGSAGYVTPAGIFFQPAPSQAHPIQLPGPML